MSGFMRSITLMIPAEKDFENTMADYLTFEFNMITHGRGYLFEDIKNGGQNG